MRYLLWNNKGGVGKTFTTYCLASEYAIANPNKLVVVVDMCPQSNVSEMLLGGNGLGEENLNTLYENGRTIASYIKNRYDKSRFGRTGTESNYFTKVNDYNKNMPSNLYILAGDMDLDICATLIDYLAMAPEKKAWINSRSILLDPIRVFEDVNDKKEITFFIDSNPSFANYTQLAILAADRLIIPCTADSASIRGIHNIMRLVYGVKTNHSLSEDDIFETFHNKVTEAGYQLPKIHSLILNKSRRHDKKAAKAFKTHMAEIEQTIKQFSEDYPDHFIASISDKVFNLKDCNTLAPILNHEGLAPSELKHKQYEIYGENTQANQEQIDSFNMDLSSVVRSL